MKQLGVMIIAGLLLVANTGCLGIVSNKRTVSSQERQVVSHDGKLLVVDVKTGEVYELPPGNIDHTSVLKVEIEEDED